MTTFSLANAQGILAQGSIQDTFGVDPPQFNAGTVNGVIHFDANPPNTSEMTLVSTPSSGVWRFFDSSGGNSPKWTPISFAWDKTDLKCIVKGHRSISDAFAAGGIAGQGVLWESTWDGTFESWIPVDLIGLSTGIVNSVTTIFPSGVPIIILACDGGTFWSLLGSGPGDPYSFQKAIVPSGIVDRWSSVAPGNGKYPDSPLFAAPWVDGTVQAALFRGFFDSEPTGPSVLHLEEINLPFPTPNPSIFRVLVAASPKDSRKRFVVVGSQNGGIAFVFRMTDDQDNPWEVAGTTVNGGAGALFQSTITGQFQDWTGALSFSELDSMTLAIGWQAAYFLSTDYGSNWIRIDVTKSDNTHSGVHSIQFSLADPDQKSLSIATDGGLFTTSDAGHTHSSTANESFPNLEFLNGALDNHNTGLVTGCLSNNLNLYTSVYGTPQLWQPLRLNDVGPTTFIRNGMLVDYDSLQSTHASTVNSTVQVRRLDPFNRPPGYIRLVDPLLFNDTLTAPNTGPLIDLSINLRPLRPVDVPSPVDVNSDSLVAVAGRQTEVCGLILSRQDAAHDNVAVHVLGAPTPGELVTAVASPDGNSVFVGTDAGNFFLGKTVSGATSFSFNFTPLPSFAPTPTSIIEISARNNSRIYAIAKGNQFLRLEGSGWSPLPGPPTNDEYVSLLVVPEDLSVFVATATQIFLSNNQGGSFTDISAGLPTSPHITQLCYIKEPGGAALLYIFTNGWSVFKKILHQPLLPFRPGQRAVTVKGVMGITYDGSLSNFNIPAGGSIDGRVIGFEHSLEVFKYVNGNGKTFADFTVRAVYRQDDSVEVTSDLFLNNFYSGNHSRTAGVNLVLDPGSSYYQNVNVNLGGGSDGGEVDVDFLVTN